MKLRELVERHKNLDFYIKIYGAAPRITRALEKFYELMRKHYPVIEADNPNFMNIEVPREVEDAFNIPFEEFRKTYRKSMRRDLK
ncbi:MAG: hypothetical protein QXS38_01595 [Candidatus Pacearchaeota archaeon]